MLAVFDASSASQGGAASAILAFLDIRDDVRRKGSFQGHELAVRAGADLGTFRVRQGEEHGNPFPNPSGSSVNLAARLEAKAGTWEILISDTLAEQVEGDFELEPRESFE